jgi:branched-subunit amino acid transport protein AzlD
VLPDINLILSLSIMFITLLFTLLPFLLSIRLNKEMFHNNYLSRTLLPEILYLLNWDKYSKSKITLKKVYIELLKGELETALTTLTKANTDYDLSKYYLWHQDVLNMLYQQEILDKLIHTLAY